MAISTEDIIFPQLYTLDNIRQVAKALIKNFGSQKVWLFEGEMGSGKTTLIKEVCYELSVLDNVTSPTYSLVNEYCTPKNQVIYHFDFYRIKSEIEAMDIGCEEYFYSGNYCFIEWPTKIPSLLPENYGIIAIDILGKNERQCNFILKKN